MSDTLASEMRRFVATLVALFALLGARRAEAQVHWDIGVHGGVAKRFLTDKTCVVGAPCRDAFFGPVVGLQAHLALIPFVRAGVYGSFEVSPLDGGPAAARNMFAFGAQAKVMSPWPRDDWRMWLTLGVGYVATYAPSYTITLRPNPDPGGKGSYPAIVDGGGGGFIEVPVGLGVSYRLRKPLMVYAELLGRFGGGFWGTVYGEHGGRAATSPLGPTTIAPAGSDFFSLGLVVGVGLDI